jgi:hypothetical protein
LPEEENRDEFRERSISMSYRTFEVGDQVRVVERMFRRGQTDTAEAIGIVRSVDTGRRRTAPYYIYYVELPGEDQLVDFEYRELELVASASD